LGELVVSLEAIVADRTREVSVREEALRVERGAELRARTRIEETRGPLQEQWAALRQAELAMVNATEAEERARDEDDRVVRLTREVKESYARQETLRAESAAKLGQLSTTFDYVVRSLLGDEVRGEVSQSGRALALSVDHGGDRDSAAVATVKLLAFDLAALTESFQGRGFFPRILLHDGPREADLAPDIYERLFLYVRALEDCATGDAPFQYIVTTITKPPRGLMRKPWHRLTLAGVPAEERLLRCDL